MDEQFKQLVEYIKQYMSQGASEETVRKALESSQWPTDKIELAFKEALKSTNVVPNVAVPTQGMGTTDRLKGASTDPNYKVLSAFSDVFGALTKNIVVYILSMIISVIVVIVMLMAVVFGQAAILDSLNVEFGFETYWLIVLAIFAYITLATLTSSLLMGVSSTAIDDGSSGNKRGLFATLDFGIKSAPRIFASQLVVMAVALFPIFLIGILSGFVGATTSGALVGLVLFLATMPAVAWSIVCYFRYALVPYVALFERGTTIRETLGRSNHLLKNGGRWFLFKAFLLSLVIYSLNAALTGQLSEQDSTYSLSSGVPMAGEVGSLISVVISLGMFVVSNGVLVMLYKNRAATRG